jgi:hypothetical protein
VVPRLHRHHRAQARYVSLCPLHPTPPSPTTKTPHDLNLNVSVAMLGRDTGSYLVTGSFRRVDDVTIEVIELPVKRWTQVRVSKYRRWTHACQLHR